MKNKLIIAIIMGIAIGVILGSLTTFFIMKDNHNKQISDYENENKSITESLGEEINKLSLKNDVYNIIDIINNRTSELVDNGVSITEGEYLFSNGDLILVDAESLNPIENGLKITDINYISKVPNNNSMVILNSKGKVSEGVFYIDSYQITYDLISTKVTKIEE